MTLLPPNATVLEKNIETVLKRNSELSTPLRTLWNPDTCPEHILPWLAWGFGLNDWKSYWPVSIKRAFIRDAIDFKRKKGTAQSVRQIVNNFGAAVVLQECWESQPKATPHTFSVVINATRMGGEAITDDFQQDIINSISQAKPARSNFTVTAGVTAQTHVGITAYACAHIYYRMELTE